MYFENPWQYYAYNRYMAIYNPEYSCYNINIIRLPATDRTYYVY